MTSAICWPELLIELCQIGMPPKIVMRAVNGRISVASIRSYMRKGVEPSHVRGELILDLWCEKTGKRREDAPRRPLRRP
ncbi:hypothetical protein WJ05_04660 [Burkholderia vietnamiensis]|uniref:hypothetical protein n=1 Tax=Burkholderia vietnamiensis TaxID=60552 RepID=UPI000753F423|nr:hypothetical protein [Burkholderia vietnamiensis]KVF16106.1 hypothetical protein WJ05_04660 [Burkholderia vietnamiensis]